MNREKVNKELESIAAGLCSEISSKGGLFFNDRLSVTIPIYKIKDMLYSAFYGGYRTGRDECRKRLETLQGYIDIILMNIKEN